MKAALLLVISATTLASTPSKYDSCHSAKEYITTYNFLKENKVVSLKSGDIQKIANEVSNGCKHSAKRFIKIYSVLTRSGLEASNAIGLATQFSLKTDEHSKTFLTLFSESFLEKYLDLNIKDAVNISKKLALDLDGDITKIKNDFQKTVSFCIDDKEINLTGPKCADIATKVVTSGAKYNVELAPIFLKMFKYATSKEGTNLATYQAINLSLELIKNGPYALKNFKDGFEFAREKKNLDLTNMKAIEFGKTMALRSSKIKLESHRE